MMGRGECRAVVPDARGMDSGTVAEKRRAERLVQGGDGANAITQCPPDHLGVLDEPVDGLTAEPPAVVLEQLRQVPVIEREQRRDAALEQAVHESLVEVEPDLVDLPDRVGEYARPRRREAVG